MSSFTYTKTQVANMVKEYQVTKDEYLFNDIFMDVADLAKDLAYKAWNKSEGIKTPKDDFVAVAFEGVMNAINTFTDVQGSDFVSYVKKQVQWTISDKLFKKAMKKDEVFYREAQSLDKPVGSEGTTFGDVVGHQIATDVDAVFAQVAESISDENTLMSDFKDLVFNFADDANSDDSSLIKLIVSTILTVENPSSKVVNQSLAVALPEVKSATLRKRKSRAIERFTAYAKENGFTKFDLSQF